MSKKKGLNYTTYEDNLIRKIDNKRERMWKRKQR